MQLIEDENRIQTMSIIFLTLESLYGPTSYLKLSQKLEIGTFDITLCPTTHNQIKPKCCQFYLLNKYRPLSLLQIFIHCSILRSPYL